MQEKNENSSNFQEIRLKNVIHDLQRLTINYNQSKNNHENKNYLV